MRDRFYVDTLDAVKWSAVVRTAHELGIVRIVHLAMFRDEERCYKNREDEPANPLPSVSEFFKQERSSLARSGAKKDIRRIALLGSKVRPELRIEVFREEFSHRRRATYFSEAFPAWMRPLDSEPLLIVVDPDTGIGAPSDKHVSPTELLQLFDRKPEPVVLCYAHRGHESEDALRARVRRVLADGRLRVLSEHCDKGALMVRVAPV